MKYIEIEQDLFAMPNEYMLAHCVSSDYALGKGIAKIFNNKFDMSRKLNALGNHTYPDCIPVGRVYNLVTKDKYFNKPTYASLANSLALMRSYMLNSGLYKVAMPKIGCGLDRLDWDKVKVIIESVFGDTDIMIVICKLPGQQ